MKNNMLLKYIPFILFFISTCAPVFAQQQELHYDPGKKYRLGYELFLKEKYSAARETFTEFLADPDATNINDRINATYYRALSGAELYHPDAENELVHFTRQYPESLKAKLAYFHAGKILYKQKKYKSAVNYFEKA